MNLLMKGAALAPPFSCTTKYSSDVYSPRPPDIRVRLLPTKPPVHFTTEQPGRDTSMSFLNLYYKTFSIIQDTLFRVVTGSISRTNPNLKNISSPRIIKKEMIPWVRFSYSYLNEENHQHDTGLCSHCADGFC